MYEHSWHCRFSNISVSDGDIRVWFCVLTNWIPRSERRVNACEKFRCFDCRYRYIIYTFISKLGYIYPTSDISKVKDIYQMSDIYFYIFYMLILYLILHNGISRLYQWDKQYSYVTNSHGISYKCRQVEDEVFKPDSSLYFANFSENIYLVLGWHDWLFKTACSLNPSLSGLAQSFLLPFRVQLVLVPLSEIRPQLSSRCSCSVTLSYIPTIY